MTASLVKRNIFLVLQIMFVGPISSAIGGEAVLVDRASIAQGIDLLNRLYVIRGNVKNYLPVDVQKLVVRLYVPTPERGQLKKIWQVDVSRIEAESAAPFVFRVKPGDLAGHDTFAVRLWRYELEKYDATEALEFVSAEDPLLVRAVVAALTQWAAREPTRLVTLHQRASVVGRLCLVEAALTTEDPGVMQYLVEKVVAHEELVDRDLLKRIDLRSAERFRQPSPFPEIGRWGPRGDSEADMASLVRVFDAGSIAMLVRMRWTGTAQACQVAEHYLRQLGLNSVDKQLNGRSRRARTKLVGVYQELARAFPREVQFRRSLAVAELRDDALFLFLTVAVAGIPASLFAWLTRHHRAFQKGG